MRGILRSGWEVVKAFGYLARLTARLFWRDPPRMLYAAWLNVFGDKNEAQKQIKLIEAKLAANE